MPRPLPSIACDVRVTPGQLAARFARLSAVKASGGRGGGHHAPGALATPWGGPPWTPSPHCGPARRGGPPRAGGGRGRARRQVGGGQPNAPLFLGGGLGENIPGLLPPRTLIKSVVSQEARRCSSS